MFVKNHKSQTLNSGEGYEGQTRYRQRYCTDGIEPKNPKCCYGRPKFCKNKFIEPETENGACGPTSYWSQWSDWKGKCSGKNEGRRISRSRRCVGGKAGVAAGCKNTVPMRRQTKRCGRP